MLPKHRRGGGAVGEDGEAVEVEVGVSGWK